MKGLSETIIIVITAVVILVAALVILVIFQGGIGPSGDFASARNLCVSKYKVSCPLERGPPADWNTKNVRVGSAYMACSELAPNCACAQNSDGIFEVSKACGGTGTV